MATTALFSVSEQLHCTLVVSNPKWVTVPLHRMFWISTEVVTALFSCYMAGATWNCCHLSTMTIQQYTRLQCHFIQSHISRVHVFSCNLPHALLSDWPESFAFYCGNTGVERFFYEYWNKSQHNKLTLQKKKKNPAAHAKFCLMPWRHSPLISFTETVLVHTSHTGFLVFPYTSCLMPWKQAFSFKFKQLHCSCMSSYLSYWFLWCPHTHPASCFESRHFPLNSFTVAVLFHTFGTGFLACKFCLMHWRHSPLNSFTVHSSALSHTSHTGFPAPNSASCLEGVLL